MAPLPAEEWGRKTAPKDGDVHMSEASSSRAKVKGESGADQPVIMRPSLFAKQKYDGVDSESSDESDDDLPAPGTLGRKIAEMKWSEGAPRIEEIEDEEQVKRRPRKFGLGDDIDEQMQMKVWGNEDDGPEVVDGDMDVDMNGEEEEFLKFSRDQLGINDEMWEDILSSRRERGGGCAVSWCVRTILMLYSLRSTTVCSEGSSRRVGFGFEDQRPISPQSDRDTACPSQGNTQRRRDKHGSRLVRQGHGRHGRGARQDQGTFNISIRGIQIPSPFRRTITFSPY